MKLRSMRIDRQPRLMVIPMIDIIFFLLVFFMMSMLTMVAQKSINLNLPQTTSAKVNVERSLPISITADGSIYVEQERIATDVFRKRLEIEKGRNPELAVVIRADAKSNHGAFIHVLDDLKAVGINRIGIATETKVAELPSSPPVE